MTRAEERGGEDVVGVARHTHGGAELAGAVAPHPCRGGRVRCSGSRRRRLWTSSSTGNSSAPVTVAEDVRSVLGRRFGGQQRDELVVVAAYRVTCRSGVGGPPAASTWRSARSRTNAGASIPAEPSVNTAKTKTWSRLANTKVALPLSPTCEPGETSQPARSSAGSGTASKPPPTAEKRPNTSRTPGGVVTGIALSWSRPRCRASNCRVSDPGPACPKSRSMSVKPAPTSVNRTSPASADAPARRPKPDAAQRHADHVRRTTWHPNVQACTAGEPISRAQPMRRI